MDESFKIIMSIFIGIVITEYTFAFCDNFQVVSV
jgi:hypothetical protein